MKTCDAYSKGIEGQYQIGSYQRWVLKVALVTDEFDFNPYPEFFSDITHEITGIGYEAGGKELVKEVPYYHALSRNTVVMMFKDTTWEDATITARGMVIYEYTGDEATSIVWHCRDFGSNKSCERSNFTIQM